MKDCGVTLLFRFSGRQKKKEIIKKIIKKHEKLQKKDKAASKANKPRAHRRVT
jgi:hypothetical protein